MSSVGAMRILIAHEALSGAGGVETYLETIIPALQSRGHAVAFLHFDSRTAPGPTRLEFDTVPTFGVQDDGRADVMQRIRAWSPDVCFSHNMRPLDVDDSLADEWPVVKMMHGYFGTCISAQKCHASPQPRACKRTFGPACLALYGPRRCGQLRPARLFQDYRWTLRQRRLLDRYAAIVVASAHMADEYQRHGVAEDRVTAIPLFSPWGVTSARMDTTVPTVLFAGRLTALKGARILADAVAEAQTRLNAPLRLIVAGDGPDRAALEKRTRVLNLEASFTGWVTGPERLALFMRSSVLAMPSVWPEPFGLVGLEAASFGIPTVAFDVGGIWEWLRDGVNGRLVEPAGGAQAFGEALASVLGDARTLSALSTGALSRARYLTVDTHVTKLEHILARAARPALAPAS